MGCRTVVQVTETAVLTGFGIRFAQLTIAMIKPGFFRRDGAHFFKPGFVAGLQRSLGTFAWGFEQMWQAQTWRDLAALRLGGFPAFPDRR